MFTRDWLPECTPAEIWINWMWIESIAQVSSIWLETLIQKRIVFAIQFDKLNQFGKCSLQNWFQWFFARTDVFLNHPIDWKASNSIWINDSLQKNQLDSGIKLNCLWMQSLSQHFCYGWNAEFLEKDTADWKYEQCISQGAIVAASCRYCQHHPAKTGSVLASTEPWQKHKVGMTWRLACVDLF